MALGTSGLCCPQCPGVSSPATKAPGTAQQRPRGAQALVPKHRAQGASCPRKARATREPHCPSCSVQSEGQVLQGMPGGHPEEEDITAPPLQEPHAEPLELPGCDQGRQGDPDAEATEAAGAGLVTGHDAGLILRGEASRPERRRPGPWSPACAWRPLGLPDAGVCGCSDKQPAARLRPTESARWHEHLPGNYRATSWGCKTKLVLQSALLPGCSIPNSGSNRNPPARAAAPPCPRPPAPCTSRAAVMTCGYCRLSIFRSS